MKMILALLTFASVNVAVAGTHNYLCISNTLQAYNSDIYMQLTPADIDQLLATPEDARHDFVVEVTKACDQKAVSLK